MAKRILVTGGAGFIGSHLCRRLLSEGNEVLCVDNFFTGRRGNVAELLDNKSFDMQRHDVTYPLHVEVDEIYNLACPASPVHYQFDPIQTTKTSVMGALNMLGLAKRLRAPILQASTSEVYGDPEVHPQHESYWGHVNTTGPRSCYDEGKRCAETLFFDYHRQHDVKIKVIRIFNTYGPNMHPADGRVVSNFIVQALEGRDITTVVAPHAEVRMLLTASEEARLRRRGIQLGGSQNAEQLAAQVTHRDAKDSTVVNFTTAADGVVTLDSSDLDFDGTVQAALDIVDTVVNHSPVPLRAVHGD